MEAIQLHLLEGHLSGRVVAMAAIVLLLCATALGLALLGLQVLTISSGDAALGTFDVHIPSPQAGPSAARALFGADGASQPFSGPDEISAASRSRA